MTPETLLLRQIHPSFVQDGRPTSQAFHPTPKDEGNLSVYDGDMIGAQDSWKHYTQILELQSVGAMAVSVLECEEQELEVTPDRKPFDEHVLIDYTQHETKTWKKKAKKLKALAITRGWQFEVE